MSERNLETVRELNRAFNRRDPRWLELYDQDGEVQTSPGLPGKHIYAGPHGVARAAALWTEEVDDYHWELHELIDAAGCVVRLFRFRSRVNAQSAWLSPPLGAVFYVRDGRITRMLTYFSWGEALQAAGVER
jgi:ketosteroid isomerase-like protein